MRKSMISILLATVLLFTFVACNRQGEDETSTSATSTTAPTYDQQAYVPSGNTTQDENASGSGTAAGGQNSNIANMPSSFKPNTDTDDPQLQAGNKTPTVISPDLLGEGKDVSVEKDANGSPKVSYLKQSPAYKYLTSGTYTLECTIATKVEGQTVSIPMVLAVSGKKSYTSMSMNKALFSSQLSKEEAKEMDTLFALLGSSSLRAALLNDGTNMYFIIPQFKLYMDIGGESTEGFSDMMLAYFNNPFKFDFGKLQYQKTSKVSQGGKEYICETYKDGEDTYRFYFSGKDLVRIEVASSGESSIFDIASVSGTVDEKLLKLNNNYQDIGKFSG